MRQVCRIFGTKWLLIANWDWGFKVMVWCHALVKTHSGIWIYCHVTPIDLRHVHRARIHLDRGCPCRVCSCSVGLPGRNDSHPCRADCRPLCRFGKWGSHPSLSSLYAHGPTKLNSDQTGYRFGRCEHRAHPIANHLTILPASSFVGHVLSSYCFWACNG